MIKGILFDYDGTLSRRFESAYRMYRWIVSKVCKDIDPGSVEFERIVQKCMLWDEYGNISKDHVFKLLKNELVPDLDIDYWKKQWSEKFCEFQVPMDGCFEILGELQKYYRLGVITNGDGSSQNAKLSALGVRGFFKTVITGGEFGVQKPDPSIYRKAAEDLGLDCGEIAFVGDTFATDITGAVRAGMYPIWMCYEHRGISDFPVRQISSLYELKDIFLGERYEEG